MVSPSVFLPPRQGLEKHTETIQQDVLLRMRCLAGTVARWGLFLEKSHNEINPQALNLMPLQGLPWAKSLFRIRDLSCCVLSYPLFQSRDQGTKLEPLSSKPATQWLSTMLFISIML